SIERLVLGEEGLLNRDELDADRGEPVELRLRPARRGRGAAVDRGEEAALRPHPAQLAQHLGIERGEDRVVEAARGDRLRDAPFEPGIGAVRGILLDLDVELDPASGEDVEYRVE